MNQDTLQQVVDSIVATAQQTTHSVNIWMIVAILELVIIAVLLMGKRGKDNKRSSIRKQVLAEGDIDFGNIMNSSFNAEALYRKLLIACHPDRFAPDEEKVAIANDLATRITKNKHDIKVLNALREEAKVKLNINI